MATSSASQPIKIKLIIPATETKTVDTIKDAQFKSLLYDCTAWKDGGNVKSMLLKVLNNNGTISDSVFGRVGNNLPLGVATKPSGSDTILEITNPNAFDVEIELLKFKIGG